MQSPRARWATAMRETRGATRVSALRNINEHSLRVNECGRDHPQRRIVYLPPSPHVYFIIRKHKPRTRNRRTDDARRERETDGREGETERGKTARGPSQTVPVARTESCSMCRTDGGRTYVHLTHTQLLSTQARPRAHASLTPPCERARRGVPRTQRTPPCASPHGQQTQQASGAPRRQRRPAPPVRRAVYAPSPQRSPGAGGDVPSRERIGIPKRVACWRCSIRVPQTVSGRLGTASPDWWLNRPRAPGARVHRVKPHRTALLRGHAPVGSHATPWRPHQWSRR